LPADVPPDATVPLRYCKNTIMPAVKPEMTEGAVSPA
jgi:hypothetical protein